MTSETPTSATALSSPTERWVIAIEFGVIAQLITIWQLIQHLNGPLTASRLRTGLLLGILFILLIGVLSFSSWRDLHVVDGHTAWQPGYLRWLVVVTVVPIIGALIYLCMRGYRSEGLYHGITGRLRRVLNRV